MEKFESISKKEFSNFEQKTEKKFEIIRNDIQEMRKTLFLLEHEQGRKIDAMYDFIMLEKKK